MKYIKYIILALLMVSCTEFSGIPEPVIVAPEDIYYDWDVKLTQTIVDWDNVKDTLFYEVKEYVRYHKKISESQLIDERHTGWHERFQKYGITTTKFEVKIKNKSK